MEQFRKRKFDLVEKITRRTARLIVRHASGGKGPTLETI